MKVAQAQATAASEQPAPEPMTNARAFEALFHRALGANPLLAEALRRAGYDPGDPQPRYPSTVWVACVELAREFLFSDRTVEEGYRELGALFADGFRATAVGSVFEGVHYTGEAYLVRLPGLLKMARPDLDAELRFESDRRCRMVVQGPHPTPHFMAGLVHARLQQRGLPVQVEVARAEAAGYELLITW